MPIGPDMERVRRELETLYGGKGGTYSGGTFSGRLNPTTQSQKEINRIFGPQAQDYAGTFKSAYESLGQRGGADPSIVMNGTQALAEAFVDSVLQKTGKLPSESQTKRFVAENLTSNFASKFILGIPSDQIKNIADNYIETNPDILAPQGQGTQEAPAVQELRSLQTRLPGLYSSLSQGLGEIADVAYAEPRRRVIEEEAALGRLRSPVSIPSLAAVDAAKAASLAQGRFGLKQAELAGTQDLSKSLSNVLQEESRIKNQARQFGQSLGLERRRLSDLLDEQTYRRGLEREALGMSSELGRRQASASRRSGLSAGLSGGLTGAAVGSGFGPWGALLGGLGGFGLGYAGGEL